MNKKSLKNKNLGFFLFVVVVLCLFFPGSVGVFLFYFFQKVLFLMQSIFKVNDVKNNHFRVTPVRNLWYILARKHSNH